MKFLQKIKNKLLNLFINDDLEVSDEPFPDLPIEVMTKESLMANGVSEAKAEFMCAVADGTIDGSCVVPSDIKSNCAVCNKDLNYDGSRCDYCERHFCSEDCAQVEDYESTFPDHCPGVYWCIICRNDYLSKAGGHLFVIGRHPAHSDLKTYLNRDPNDWAFVDQCMTCGMWCYEFASDAEGIPGKYEGQACGVKIRDKNGN